MNDWQRLKPEKVMKRLRDSLLPQSNTPSPKTSSVEPESRTPAEGDSRLTLLTQHLQQNLRMLQAAAAATPVTPILTERFEQLQRHVPLLTPEFQERLNHAQANLQQLLQWQSVVQLTEEKQPSYPDPLGTVAKQLQQHQLVQEGQKRIKALTAPLTLPLAAAELRYHQWIHDHIDPLFGRERHEQLRSLSGGRAENLSQVQKNANNVLAWGGGSFALTSLAIAAGMPMGALSLGFGLVLIAPGLPIAYQKAVVERKFSYIHLGMIYVLGLYGSGMLTIGVSSLLAAAVAYKFGAFSEAILHSSMISIFGQQPRTVWRIVDGVETEVPFEQIARGDILVCDAGQVIPADGLVVSGAAAVDQHMLTGESQPAEKGIGDAVLAATVVLSGRILVEVYEAGATTTVAKIADILNRSASYHLSLEEKIVAIADRTLPATLTGSGLALLFSGPIGAIIVMGSNYTINMAGILPYTLLKFLNYSSQAGVLVKEGAALERLRAIDTMVFDKTGTLTLEQPRLVATYTAGTLGTTAILRLAAAAEQRQSHPIARAILAAAAERQLEIPSMVEARYEIGYGLTVQLPGDTEIADGGSVQQIHVGSARFMEIEGIALPEDLLAVAADCRGRGTALVWVAREGVVVGALELEATVRPEAQALVTQLKQRGMAIYIISGDQEAPTRHLAEALGIDGYFANTLPDQKANLVKELQAQGRKVCFVGDGINDAIALRQADVSVSLAGATTAAIDTAQVVLMGSDLGRLVTMLELVDEMHNNLDENYKASIAISLIGAGSVIFLHAGFLVIEALFVASIAAGIAIANKQITTAIPRLTLSVEPGDGS